MFVFPHQALTGISDRIKRIELDREMISPEKDARLIKMGGILSHYVTLSGKEIKRARDKIFYYLVGLCFLFTTISIPLAKIFLEPTQQWLIVFPPLLVIILSYLRERRASKRDSLYIVSSAWPGDFNVKTRLGKECEKKIEIEMFWGYRPVALKDMRAAVQNSHRLKPNPIFFLCANFESNRDYLGF